MYNMHILIAHNAFLYEETRRLSHHYKMLLHVLKYLINVYDIYLL